MHVVQTKSSNPPLGVPEWRIQLLNKILVVTFALGTVMAVLATTTTIQDGRFGLLALVLIVYALLGAVTFIRRWRYSFRAGILLILFFSAGLISFELGGVAGVGPYFLLGFITLAALLLDNRAAIFALLLSIATLAFFGWLSGVQGQRFPLEPYYSANNLFSWVRLMLAVTLFSVAVTVSIGYLLQRLETELNSSRADTDFLSSVLDTANVLVVVLDSQGRIVRLNQTCQQVCGYSLAEVENLFFWDIFVSDSEKDSVAASFRRMPANDHTLQTELSTPTQAGQLRIISWSSSMLPAEVGSHRYLVAVGVDITEQKNLLQERERLLAAEREQRERAETLYQATTAVTSALEVQEVLDNILIQLRRVLPFDSACVFLEQAEGLRAVAAQGLPDFGNVVGTFFDASDALFQHLKKTKQPFTITDAQKDPRFLKWGDTGYVRGWMGVPLIARQKVIGHLTLDSRTVGAYDNTNTALAQAFANQAAGALVNAQLFDQMQTTLTKTHALYKTMRSLISTHDLPEMLQSAADSAAEAVSANRLYIDLIDVEHRQIEKTVTNRTGAPRHQSDSFDVLWNGLVGWAIRERKPAISPKNIPDPRESEAMQQLRKQLNS
ncbi:MAG: GAF domain-containing protein, partial [Chloroflexi bacterium]